MKSSLTVRNADKHDVLLIHQMAHQVWPATYSSIVPDGQVAYMLQLIYSPESLTNQIENLNHHFLILEQEAHGAGFAAYSETEPKVFKLHKLYVLTELQGKGAGRILLDRVIENIRNENGEKLILNVNRNNNAKSFYEKQGFKISREEKMDIGGGYYMDDYIMELKLN